MLFGLVIKNWELIKFWMFLKFGIEFKDKIEMLENVADIDYDAFINYKYVMLLTVTSTKIKTQDICGFFKKLASLALFPTLYANILTVSFFICDICCKQM